MPVSYKATNGLAAAKTHFLIPAPHVQINKSYDRTGDGAIIGVRYGITLTGTLVAHRGSPDYSGQFSYTKTDPRDELNVPGEKWMYRSIQNKQMAMRKLFAHHNEGAELHIQALDSDPVGGFKCNPRIVSIDFSQKEGQPNLMSYTIQLEADAITGPTTAAGTSVTAASCSDPSYSDESACTGAGETWTPASALLGTTVAGLTNDPEGRLAGKDDPDGVNNRYFQFAVKSANENWSIDEQEGRQILISEVPEAAGSVSDKKGDPDFRRYRHKTIRDAATLSGFKEIDVDTYKASQDAVDAAEGTDDDVSDHTKILKNYKQIGGYRLQKVVLR